MTEAMPFLQKYDITFLRPPTILAASLMCLQETFSLFGKKVRQWLSMKYGLI